MENKKVLNALIIIVSIVLVVEVAILAIMKNSETVAAEVEYKKDLVKVLNNYFDEIVKDESIKNSVISTDIGKTDISRIDGFYIKVNYQENVVTIYIKDSEGNYTVPYKAMVCSTGKSTPKKGVYKVSDRGLWGLMVGKVYAQYYTRISGAILFHSVPYTKKSPDTLEYWEYDKLGTTASAGCVRLTVEDAKWIYDNCKPGTKVEFYADSDPGPLGKPTAQKISGAEERLRNWDPTDVNPTNPWTVN